MSYNWAGCFVCQFLVMFVVVCVQVSEWDDQIEAGTFAGKI